MKRIIAMVLAVLMVVTLAACSNKVKDIDGVLTGYVQVGEYVGPLAVIEDNGKTYYLMSTEQTKKPCGARHSGPFVVQ